MMDDIIQLNNYTHVNQNFTDTVIFDNVQLTLQNQL